MNATIEELKTNPLYSEELGIKLETTDDEELFKWFLASVLFGARISEAIARKTYKAFEKYKLTAPRAILQAGWDFLVNPVMREGGYVRYDEKTSREILRNCEMLLSDYGGSLSRLHDESENERDLEARLLRFYGVGPVTVNIFLRELRPYWKKADPAPLPVVLALASKYGINLNAFPRKSLTFARIEAGLIRLRKELRQKAA
jgi:endonuclease III